MTDSERIDRRVLNLERDLPTTPEDTRILGELRNVQAPDPLVHANRLRSPNWTIAAAAARPTFEGAEPFEL